jgi:hypothetical protein
MEGIAAAIDSICIVQNSVSYTFDGFPRNSNCDFKLFPVTDIGENHLSFLTVFPIRIHSRVSLLFYSRFDPKEALSLDGNVMYCVPGRYASGYRYQIVVLFDLQCIKDVDLFLKSQVNDRMFLGNKYQAAV